MSKLIEYRELITSVRSGLGCWKSYSLLQFTTSLTRLMRREKVSGRKLASRLGVSPIQVSKVLSGQENLTIETMANFADALGAAVHIHVAKKGVEVEWRELPSVAQPERLVEVAGSATAGAGSPEPPTRTLAAKSSPRGDS